MGNIGDPITTGSIPAVGTSGTTYAENLNLFLTEVKSRLEADVPKTSLAAGELNMGGSPVFNVSSVGLSNVSSVPTGPNNTLQSYGDELYWINSDGAAKLTDNGVLNAAGVKGITGDYGGVNPAQFRFVDADQEYYAYDDFGGLAWARIWAKNFDLAAGATSSFRVRMAFTGGASYTMTLPAAVPAANALVKMSSSGALSTTTSVSRTVVTSPPEMVMSGVTNVWTYLPNKWTAHATVPSTCTLAVPFEVPVGATITNAKVRIKKISTNVNTTAMTLYETTDGTNVSVGSASNNGNADGLHDLDAGVLSITVASNKYYYIQITCTSNTNGGDEIYWASITYSEPVA